MLLFTREIDVQDPKPNNLTGEELEQVKLEIVIVHRSYEGIFLF